MKRLLLVGSFFFVIPLISIVIVSSTFEDKVKIVADFQKPENL